MTGRYGTIQPVEADGHALKHGSYSTYTNWACRCRACKDANAAEVRRMRANRRQRTRDNGGIAPVDRHGDADIYGNWGCRCAPCTADHSRRERMAKAKRRQAADVP